MIWNINRKAGSIGKDFIHPAIYPNKLIDRIITLCSHEWDTILEPFLWSWTTLISALNKNRNCISYEFNEWFMNLIKYRIKNEVVNANHTIRIYSSEQFIHDGEVFRK